ncbi:hypothetical protein ACFFK0_02805 [Paenibacillus chartarius]|uniref:RNA polymerase sigma-70 region 4 domain-containing protein n=1 Tax=Paenibacillus chartarius TaxID=747481 RepID=A0ABV6DFH7_9BACL
MQLQLQVKELQTPEERTAVMSYVKQNEVIFQNPVIQGFFHVKGHLALLAQVLLDPSEENCSQLESTFSRYFFRVRFTKYLCSLIRFCNIDIQRKRTRDENRLLLVFDKPLDEEGDATFGELMHCISNSVIRDSPLLNDPYLFHESIEDESLYDAFTRLTDKQKLVITLSYSLCQLDTEIANLLCVSQQAITKTRKTALIKMRQRLAKGNHPHVVMSGYRKEVN